MAWYGARGFGTVETILTQANPTFVSQTKWYSGTGRPLVGFLLTPPGGMKTSTAPSARLARTKYALPGTKVVAGIIVPASALPESGANWKIVVPSVPSPVASA